MTSCFSFEITVIFLFSYVNSEIVLPPTSCITTWTAIWFLVSVYFASTALTMFWTWVSFLTTSLKVCFVMTTYLITSWTAVSTYSVTSIISSLIISTFEVSTLSITAMITVWVVGFDGSLITTVDRIVFSEVLVTAETT